MALVSETVDVVVIGAGQAGLSTGYHLRRRGVTPFVILDHSPAPGGAWQFRWPTLTLRTVHGIFGLPDMPVPPFDPDDRADQVIPAYFAEYEHRFDLPVRRPVDVTAVHELPDGRLRVITDHGDWNARAIVNATGTWDKPFVPHFPGQESFTGRQLHTVNYRGPEQFRKARVVVVGAGASAMQHLMELAPVAAATRWVTRRPPQFTEGEFDPDWGRHVVAAVADRVRRGLPPESVIKATGYRLTPPIRAAVEAGILDRHPMFRRIRPDGVEWADGGFFAADTILWATGFRAALDHLAPLRLRRFGGGITMDGTQVAGEPRVHLVGYGPSASTVGANRAGRQAAVRLSREPAAVSAGRG